VSPQHSPAVESSTAENHAHASLAVAGRALADNTHLDQTIPSDASLTSAFSSAAVKSSLSACAQQCFQQAKTLGFERVAGDSLACFMPYKGKKLSTYDCCDKVSRLVKVQQWIVDQRGLPELSRQFYDLVSHLQCYVLHSQPTGPSESSAMQLLHHRCCQHYRRLRCCTPSNAALHCPRVPAKQYVCSLLQAELLLGVMGPMANCECLQEAAVPGWLL
jgi:hypothetical protein